MTINTKSAVYPAHRRDIASLIEYMERHLDLITVEKAVAKSGYSRAICMALFSDHANMSMTTYLRRRRITEAYKKLRGCPESKIMDVAAEFGMYCGPTFFKQFRNQFHISPKDVARGLIAPGEDLQPMLTEADLN